MTGTPAPGSFHFLRRGTLQKVLAVVLHAGPAKGFTMVRAFSETASKWSRAQLVPTTNLFHPVNITGPEVARALKFADTDLTQALLDAPQPRKRRKAKA